MVLAGGMHSCTASVAPFGFRWFLLLEVFNDFESRNRAFFELILAAHRRLRSRWLV